MSAVPKSSADWLLDQTPTLAEIRAQQDAEDAAYLIFRKSVEAGDSESVQRAFFGNRFQLLLDRYHLEQPLKCFDCEEELDEDDARASRADIKWTDPLCSHCSDKRNRANR